MKHNLVADNDTDYSVVALKQSYTEIMEELQRFAQMTPCGTVDEAEVELAEASLLALEEHILARAAKMRLRTDEDVVALVDIWTKAVEVKDADESGCQSDKIAMNIFRYFTG